MTSIWRLKEIVLLMSTFTLVLLQILLVLSLSIAYYIFFYVISYLFCRLLKLFYKSMKMHRIKKIIHYGALGFVLVVYITGYVNMIDVEKTYYSVSTDCEFQQENDEYKVALVADIHYGATSSEKTLISMCKAVNEENVDFVLLLGDIVDENSSYEDMEEVFSYLSKLNSKYGTYFIYGNHDRQMLNKPSSRAFSQEELESTIIKNGITILKDDFITINDDIILVGRDDPETDVERKNIAELMKNVSTDKYVLMMNHRPQECEESEQYGVDLLVSGHTHNGQVWPLNLILKYFVRNNLMYGLRESDCSDFKVIVTSGIGGWALPIRNSSPAECVFINIVGQ